METFVAQIEWDPETKLYVAAVPGIVGAHTQGATLAELQANLKEVLELCVEELCDRIVVDPEIHRGDPCIRGTRFPVAIIIGSLARGETAEEIIEEYPQLTEEDIAAAQVYSEGREDDGSDLV